MSLTEPANTYPLQYDGKTHELYKIYLLNILLNILTLGIYHFWGKTRKRRYITSSFVLDNDRFEYTGYGGELLIGLLLGICLLIITFVPLMWAFYEIYHTVPAEKYTQTEKSHEAIVLKKQKIYRFQISDPFGNKFAINYANPINFNIEANKYYLSIAKKKSELSLEWKAIHFDIEYYVNISFNPSENTRLLLAIILFPIYLLFYFIYLPFVIVYGSLRYRMSRLRFRGIRGHLEGSSLLYGLLGLIQTFLKCVTLGFWIPFSDIIMYKYKIKKLFFGNQNTSYSPSLKTLINMNLATIGASLYLAGLVAFCAYWLIPWIISHIHPEKQITEVFTNRVLRDGYYICLILLIWLCYAPRYWYRAAFLRERYNHLRFGEIGFHCQAKGIDYLKLFVINDLIFVFSLGLGIPLIWQRRMQFFCRHVTVIGNLKELTIEQAPGKKTKFGGGFASIMNLEIGLI